MVAGQRRGFDNFFLFFFFSAIRSISRGAEQNAGREFCTAQLGRTRTLRRKRSVCVAGRLHQLVRDALIDLRPGQTMRVDRSARKSPTVASLSGDPIAKRAFDRSRDRTGRYSRRNSSCKLFFRFVVRASERNMQCCIFSMNLMTAKERRGERERERERVETRRCKSARTVWDPAERRRSRGSGANQYFFQQTLNFDYRPPLVSRRFDVVDLHPFREQRGRVDR